MDLIYGINAVEEALKSRGRAFDYVAVSKERQDARLQRVIAACRAAGVAVRFETREQLTRLAKTAAHQGVVALAAQKKYDDLESILENKRGEFHFLLLLDGVEDPHNLGALMRTADAAAVDGVIIPERRAVGVTATVAKASAGASEHISVAKVTNIGRAVEEIKAQNIWTVGLDERGGQSYDEIDYKMNCAIVLGAEGHGLHEQVRKKCDFLVSIPMLGSVPSLNVSVAGAIVMYEVVRQRRAGQK
jgi:23S rRNA (guanosine2251-2'-O)-methyltransferase